uniref:Glycosyltransferase, GT2 family n=1 Tax=Candidatus Kentrum sp. DK TaxID=2126562 RepID=A0A450TDJ4_9GAMM|nr:MAG: Glycosyltransferase, GT2 family [Candidatus Kentron sp. DK]
MSKFDHEIRVIEESGLFDRAWYLAEYPDVKETGMDPVRHYLWVGARLHRNPSSKFITAAYLSNNPDVAEQNLNPLVHFILHGRAEGRSPFDRYEKWIEEVEQPVFEALDVRLAHSARIPRVCLISMVMPVYNIDTVYLTRAIESVRRQSYPHWELCICDDASTDDAIRNLIREMANRDKRIKYIFREENGHISAASNDALKLATGDFVALLDHDDELARHALYFVVRAIEEFPEAKFIYSDEDKIDSKGQRREPYFKPEFNLDLLYSQNYVSHLGVYRRDMLEKIGGFRLGVEGSQDYDLLLRCLLEMEPDNIVHIPQVLYHWRAILGSTSLDVDEKGYAVAAGMKALRHHFEQRAISNRVTTAPPPCPHFHRVHWPIPEPASLVSLLIPTRNRVDLLSPCVESILEKTTYPNVEILIIDNGSDDPATLKYLAQIKKQERIRVLPYNRPFNYSAINNFGAEHARGELLGLVNNDVEVIEPDWLTEMASQALRPDIGCVGAKLLYGDGTVQHGGVILGLGGIAGHSHKKFPGDSPGYFWRLQLVQNLSAVTAACLVVKKALFDRVGGLDEKNLPVAFNDVDLCLRIRALGVRNLYTPYAVLYHHESKSRGAEDTPQKRIRFRGEVEYIRKTWSELLDADPCYSPHLTQAREDFSIAAPYHRL